MLQAKARLGRLLLAISWSPSFNYGTTSDFFQADGKTEVNKERLTITVRIGRIHGRASLSTDIDTLFWPEALFDGKDITIFRISLLETGWKQNLSTSEISLSGTMANRGARLCTFNRDLEASKALAPTEVKNWLNLSATSFKSLVYTCWVVSLWGIQLLITFHFYLVFWEHSSSSCRYPISASLNLVFTSSCKPWYNSQSKGIPVRQAFLNKPSLLCISSFISVSTKGQQRGLILTG